MSFRFEIDTNTSELRRSEKRYIVPSGSIWFLPDFIFYGRMRDKYPINKRLKFEEEYLGYKERCLTNPKYIEQLEGFGSQASEKVSLLAKLPDVFIAIPLRGKYTTSQTVETILEDCTLQGVKAKEGEAEVVPFIIIYHNFTGEADKKVMADLDKIRDLPNVLVIDEKIPKDTSIGDIRGLVSDVAMESIYSNEELRKKPPILGTMDADVTAFDKAGTLLTVLNQFKLMRDKQLLIDSLTLKVVSDPWVFREHATELRRHLIFEQFSKLSASLNTWKFFNTVGNATFYDPASLAAIGSFPPLTVAEDHATRNGFSLLRGNDHTCIGISSIPVSLDESRKIVVDMRKQAYYANFDAMRDKHFSFDDISDVVDLQEVTYILLQEFIDRIRVVGGLEALDDGGLLITSEYCRLFVKLNEQLINKSLSSDELYTIFKEKTGHESAHQLHDTNILREHISQVLDILRSIRESEQFDRLCERAKVDDSDRFDISFETTIKRLESMV